MLASLGVFVEWMFEIFGGHRKEASHRFEDNGRRNSKKILLLPQRMHQAVKGIVT
jgi:hypothetical protein